MTKRKPEIFVTADQHFFHNNIIKFCDRPFKDRDEMTKELIHKWNELVMPEDMIFILGDFSFGSYNPTMQIIYALNGKKKFIAGGHDSWINTKAVNNPDIEIMDSIVEVQYTRDNNDKWFILCHYPIEEWNKKHYGSIHLHGHSHGNLKRIVENRYDIGVDTNQFYPYFLKEFIK